MAEVFVGLMVADCSFVLYAPFFRPDLTFTRFGQFGFRELVRAGTSN